MANVAHVANAAAANALSARGLRKSFGSLEVVSGVSLAVESGECFGLLGPNGAGKTTTLKLCLGLTEPDAGDIELLGEPVPRRAREARRRVGVVPQFDNLDPDFTVAENLLVYGRYFGMRSREIAARVPELLEFAGLAGRADSKISTLSGGMKRRLTLARALVNDPQIVFMDEPTTGLDPQARHVIWERLRRLTQQGKTLVLTTHFMEEAERLCHRLAIMDHGRIITEGTPRALIAQHIEPQVLEVHGVGFEAWAEQAKALCPRVERAGDTVFCYTEQVDPLIADLSEKPGLTYLHRRASLEDVFLKLTGRDLRD
jgi:lipooligosaccharide transport system ATP-binding protein